MSAHTLRVAADNASAAGVLMDAAALRILADKMDRLRDALNKAKRGHYYCEDAFYSCPLAAEGCADDREPKDKCNCGAEEFNAAIDAVLAETE